MVVVLVVGVAGRTQVAAGEPPPEPVPASVRSERSDAETRARSRTAYGNQTAERALETLRQRHPDLLPPPWRALEQTPDPVDTFIGDHAARVDLGDGKQGLVESVLPLRGRGPSGDKVPLDFRLGDQGEFFAPQVPLVRVRLPKRLSDGIELPDIGVSVSALGADGGAVAQRAEGSAFWANAGGRDTDVIATPLPWGVQILGYLRSAESPEEVRLRLTLPTDAHAELSERDAGGIVIERGNDVLARVSAPIAYDADGKRIDASYELSGETLTVRVAHRDADAHYPIVLDPVVGEDQRHWNTNSGMDFNGWEQGSSGPFAFWPGDWWLGRGLYVYDADAFYNNGNSGYWRFNAPGSESFVYAAEFHYVRTVDQDTCFEAGLTSPYVKGRWCNANLNYISHGQCAAAGCPATAGTANNSARILMQAAYYSKYRDWFWAFVGGTLVWLNDLTAPTLSGYGPYTYGWYDNTNRSMAPLGIDNGLGIKQWKLSLPGQPDRYRTHECAGHRHDRCPYYGVVTGVSPNVARTTGGSFTYSTGELPEGVVTVRGYASDFAGNWSPPLVHHVKVDHNPPAIALSGSLAETHGRTVNYSSIYRLRVDATDGTATDPRIGVKSIEIEVNNANQDVGGTTQYVATQSCATDSCPMTREWHFVPSRYGPGEYTIKVIAKDQFDHRAERILKVEVPSDPGCGGGSLSLTATLGATLPSVNCPGAMDKEVAVDTRLRADGAAASNYAGSEIANVGDVNGDSRPDFAVLAPSASTAGRTRNGAVYVLFGRSTPPDAAATGPNATTIPLGNLGANGFRIDGNWPDENLADVVGLGDINGDGYDDLAVSNTNSWVPAGAGGGRVYVVFGKSGTGSIDLQALGSGTPGGYQILGVAQWDNTGAALARLDDLNGDGRDDLAIGVPYADNNSRPESGSVYIVYSKPTTGDISLGSLGTNGFRIDGPPASHTSFGIRLLAAGDDFNGDDKPDVVVGNPWADPNGRTRAGSAWVVFGQPGSGNVDLNAPGNRAYRIDGAVAEDRLGTSAASAGDLNGDNISELAVGAPRAENNRGGGSVYVVAGRPRVGTVDMREPLGTDGYRIDGDYNSDIGNELARLSDVNGDNLPDLAIGSENSRMFVVYGQATFAPVDLSLRTFNGYRIGGAGSWSTVADAGNFLATGTPTLAIGDNDPRSFTGSVYFLDAKPRVQ